MFAYAPRVELGKTDGSVYIYLRQAVGGGTGDAFVAYCVINVTMRNECDKLFGTIFLYFLYIDGVADFVS